MPVIPDIGFSRDNGITRETARDEAANELSKGVYHADDPSLVEQVFDKVINWLDRLLTTTANAAPGGLPALLAILAVVGTVVILLLFRAGPFRRTVRAAVFDHDEDTVMSADDHRSLADNYAAQHRYELAVRERMRAITVELESRGVLEPRPGRTADEVASDAGREVPELTNGLRRAARIFDDVWYGGRPASAAHDRQLHECDEVLRRTVIDVGRSMPSWSGSVVTR